MDDKLQTVEDSLKDKIIKYFKITLAGGVAATSTLDPTAGIIASLLGAAIMENLPNFKLKNQEQFLEQLAIELYNLRDKIDTDFLKKDEFVYLLNKCLRLALEEIDDAKRRAYINILTHTCINPNQFRQIDFYLHIIQSLSSIEIHTLAFFSNPDGYLEIRGIDKKSVTGGMTAVLKKNFPELTQDEFRVVLKMLFNKGLTNTDEGIIGAMTASSGLRLVEGRLTKSGNKLIKYASDYKNQL